jgi:hypothetical protein
MLTEYPNSTAANGTSAPVQGRGQPSEPAPRVTVRASGPGLAVEVTPDTTEETDTYHGRFLAAFGTTELAVAEASYQQLLNTLCPGQLPDNATANLALALLHRIAPKDELEAMLGCQMIVAHIAAMDASRRALHVEQSAGGRQAYLSLARKLMTLYVAQLDALNRNRGKATVQKVVVERVNMAPGAQAIVGAVAARLTKGGGGAE